MNRSQTEKEAIRESEEYQEEVVESPIADQELRNWAAWIRSIPSPIPRESAKGLVLFTEFKPMYPDPPKLRIMPEIDRAEICEQILCEHCEPPEIVCFYLTYVMQLTNQQSAERMNLRERKLRGRHTKLRNKYNNVNYSALLKSAMRGLNQFYAAKIAG